MPRRLPSHLVMQDVEAEGRGVGEWLAGSGYALAQRFAQGALQGDAHAAPGSSAREFRLYIHSCADWDSARYP